MRPGGATPFPELVRDLEALSGTGVLPCQQIRQLIEAGHVRSDEPIAELQFQPASLDLRLGSVAYQVRASFLPTVKSPVLRRVDELKVREVDLSSLQTLEKGGVYIVPLMEELNLPRSTFAKANPKSTIGRLDVLTRLVTDYGGEFDRVPRGYKGRLYAEIAPRSFSITLGAGARLNQLRFMRGSSASSDSDRKLTKLHQDETLVYFDDGDPGRAVISRGLWISVDLEGGRRTKIVGYRAKKDAGPIDLERVDYYEPADYWETILRPKNQEVILKPGEFYVLASREKIRVPPTFAAEMVGYDPSVGEFRIHYAGFFDPGFGYGNNDVKGTKAVLEVRSHEVPFLLKHGERVGRLIYERLLAMPEKIYGSTIGSSYQHQALTLSKQFKRVG